jgi:type VI secretion system protein ImpA
MKAAESKPLPPRINTLMAGVALEALISPVSDTEPCGRDLDLAGDPDYMNFVAKTESLVPTTFFSGPENKPFDRTSIDFPAEFRVLEGLLVRTRDIRLLTVLAKYSILNRDLVGFATAVRAIQQLLKDQWDEVHPRGEDGVFSIRMAAIETLDDMAPVIFPLQYAQLIRHPRIGSISYRDYMIAAKEAEAREGESTHDQATIERALMEVELTELVDTLGRFESLRTALADIRDVCAERAGFEQAARFERLPALVDKIRTLLNSAVIKRDPSAALDDKAPSPDGTTTEATVTVASEVASVDDAADALAAVAEYFSRHEPSNPALLLVQQATQLMGKSFVEVLRILMPTHVEQAAIHIGGIQTVPLPIERLSALVSDSNSDGGAFSPPTRRLEATSRVQALRLLEQVGAFYRSAEPSSPLPFLTDRARELAGRDFLSLLKHVLPEEALRSNVSEDKNS